VAKGRSTLPALLLALVLAGVGTMLLLRYVDSVKKQARASIKNVERINVVIAARDIPQNVLLRADMLTTKSVAKDSVPSDAVVSIAEIKELYTRVPILKDDVLRRSKIVTREEAGSLAFRIPEGRRAITLNITESKAVGFSINPGERVDVIGIFQVRDPATDEDYYLSRTILQDIPVLEISTSEIEEEKSRSRSATRAPVATLAVTPEEAEVIALVESEMKLVLTLRPHGDAGRIIGEGAKLADILGIQPPAPAPQAPAPEPQRTVEIFAGGNRSSAPVPR
jgi:pilus assembly protein CpaB